jgi:hypothetical protein
MRSSCHSPVHGVPTRRTGRTRSIRRRVRVAVATWTRGPQRHVAPQTPQGVFAGFADAMPGLADATGRAAP